MGLKRACKENKIVCKRVWMFIEFICFLLLMLIGVMATWMWVKWYVFVINTKYWFIIVINYHGMYLYYLFIVCDVMFMSFWLAWTCICVTISMTLFISYFYDLYLMFFNSN